MWDQGKCAKTALTMLDRPIAMLDEAYRQHDNTRVAMQNKAGSQRGNSQSMMLFTSHPVLVPAPLADGCMMQDYVHSHLVSTLCFTNKQITC